jgi:hypothetical protein
MRYGILMMLVVLGAATTANATKARLAALGQSTDGSYYLLDGRNIFLNPAAVHQLSPFMNFEMGASQAAFPAPNNPPTPISPNAEGGFLRVGDTFRYGIQLGRRGQTAADIAVASANAGFANMLTPQNTVDFVIGGSTPVLNWGAGILYGSAKQNAATQGGFPNKESSAIELRGGVKMNQIDGYLHLTPSATSKTQTSAGNTDEYKPSLALRLGGGYDMDGGWRAFADIQSRGAKAENTSGTASNETTYSSYTLGIAQQSVLDGNTKLFYSAGLRMTNLKQKDNLAGVETKSERTYIPLTIGLEGEGTTWVTWRASVSQNVLIDTNKAVNTDEHNPNSTIVGVGTGLKFGKFMLDTTLSAAANGFIDTSAGNFLANASLTYPF